MAVNKQGSTCCLISNMTDNNWMLWCLKNLCLGTRFFKYFHKQLSTLFHPQVLCTNARLPKETKQLIKIIILVFIYVTKNVFYQYFPSLIETNWIFDIW